MYIIIILYQNDNKSAN